MDKFQKLYEKVIDILAWAEDNKHISSDARDILEDNITEAKEDIEKE